MKRIYRRLSLFLEQLPGKNYYFKIRLAERWALWRKGKLIHTVHWNKQQQTEFKRYWQAHYKPITGSGHKLFEAVNGVFRPDYMPDFLFATKVEPYFNDYRYAKIYSDKSLTELLYKDRSKAVFPQNFLLNSGGCFFDGDRKKVSKKTAEAILSNIRDAVVKPTIGGNSGKGIIIGHFDEKGFDAKNNFQIRSLLDEGQKDFVVQERIVQSDALNRLYPHSINTFRVISYLVDAGVKIAPVSLRMGAGGNQVDNVHSGGLVVGVDSETERLKETAYKLGYSDTKQIFKQHPDTKTAYLNFEIPGIKEIIEAAKILHGHTPHIGMISWDFTLNSDNMPVLVEANYVGQTVWFPQIANARPIFGEDTPEILKKIR